MKFTPNQISAIDTRKQNLLVSAGAGSGKTTVLTRRLIKRILSGDSVTDFLVVTFMKAAASDIKRKLYDALIEESAKNPQDEHIFRQTFLVSEANICTISSYCLSLVKENFALLGISPRVRVIDETESAMILRSVTDSLIAKGYEDESPSFFLLADNFSGDKNDNPLADTMISLYNTLRVTLGREELLKNNESTLRRDAAITREKGFFSTVIGKETASRLKTCYDELASSAYDIYNYAATVATDDKYLVPLDRLVQVFESARASLETNYVNFCSAAAETVATISLARSGCSSEDRAVITERKQQLVKTAKSLYNRYCRGDDALIADSFEKTADIVASVNAFLTEMDTAYESAKLEAGVLDYTDFELKALKLLEVEDENGNKLPSELCLKKQKAFKEILIDEYQDVNPLQDRLFCLLSGTNSRFMVGDVKQSIYRFRNAYPDIFLSYKAEYPDVSELSDNVNARIFLRENFRCSQTVIDYVNSVFQCVTKDTPYYREYEGEWLIHASDRIERHHPVVLAVAEKDKDKAKDAKQSEAEFIAREILRLVNSETSDDGKPLKFSDCAVMLGAMKGYSIDYEKAFRKYGVPYKTETSRNFLENPDIRLAVSALRAIDDPTDDISLCAYMRSPVCRFTSEDLYRIRLQNPLTDFWTAVNRFAVPKRKRFTSHKYHFTSRKSEPTLVMRCKHFLDGFSYHRQQSVAVTCCQFLKGFLVSSGLLRISASTGNRDSLLLLFEYARKYESASNHGLSGFLDYLSELSKSGKEIADAAQNGENDAVSFITVHKSKGLEYKVCFLAGTEKRFMGLKNSSDITVLRREGIFFRLRDRKRLTTYDPICNVIAADKEKDAILGEELRKLYVALTRAKERLYITGCANADWRNTRYAPSSAKSWLELLLYTADCLGEKSFYDLMEISDAEGNAGFVPPKRQQQLSPTRDMLDILNYSYPYSESVKTAAKISVSELREGLLEDDEYNRLLSVPYSRVSLKPSFASAHTVSASDKGTATHLFMQFCDFDKVDRLGIEAEADRLVDMRMITAQQRDMLDLSALKAFFGGRLYARIRQSKQVYREKRFSVRDLFSDGGESVLVQGVIDCFFENPDGSFTVVDYKTDRVKTLDELAQRHRVQLLAYKTAVERMTGKTVSETLLYSFALDSEVGLC